MPQSQTREYAAEARSTEIFGRVLCSARNHHVIVDGPVQNGCPGEELTPPELFLASVASCGVELVQVIAKEHGAPLDGVHVWIRGVLDRSNPVRQDYTVFNTVAVEFRLDGITPRQGEELVKAFKGR